MRRTYTYKAEKRLFGTNFFLKEHPYDAMDIHIPQLRREGWTEIGRSEVSAEDNPNGYAFVVVVFEKD